MDILYFKKTYFLFQGFELTEKTKENESLKLNNKNLDEKLIDLTRQNSGMLFSFLLTTPARFKQKNLIYIFELGCKRGSILQMRKKTLKI